MRSTGSPTPGRVTGLMLGLAALLMIAAALMAISTRRVADVGV